LPRKKSEIMDAQEKYLETGDPAEIERLYKNLLNLAFFILARQGRYQDEDDAIDIVTDLCMRLMERREPVLEGAPSAYIKAALFYKRKTRKNTAEDIDDNEDAEAGDESFLWEFIDKVARDVGLTDSDSDRLARQTIESRTRWRLVYRNISDPVLRKEYKNRMKEIERCVRSSANSLAVSGQ